MIDVCNKLVDNGMTREELLERVTIENTRPEDMAEICNTLSKAFDMYSPKEAFMQLVNSRARMYDSVKLVDRHTGEIYGLLMFCEYPITIGSPIIHTNMELAEYLGPFRQINGHSFIIDERLRGTGLDRKMLFKNIGMLKEYDFIWIGVEKSLKSHSYWERLGFIRVFEIPEAVFYMMPLNKNMIN